MSCCLKDYFLWSSIIYKLSCIILFVIGCFVYNKILTLNCKFMCRCTSLAGAIYCIYHKFIGTRITSYRILINRKIGTILIRDSIKEILLSRLIFRVIPTGLFILYEC